MTAHLDDEQLSAALDGEDLDSLGTAHFGGCPTCTGRQQALAAAAQALAAPVTPIDAALLDALIATAVAEAEGDGATVVSLETVRARRARPPLAWLVGAAAALVVLVGVGGLAARLGQTEMSDTAGRPALKDEGFRDAAGPGGAASGAMAPADPEVVTLDLGDQEDPAALAGVLAASFAPTAVAAEAQTTAENDSAGQATPLTPPKDSPMQRVPMAAGKAVPERAQCSAQARSIGGALLGAQLSTATLRWKGQPAEVLVFALTEPAAGFSRQALVFRRPGCGLLADPRF